MQFAQAAVAGIFADSHENGHAHGIGAVETGGLVGSHGRHALFIALGGKQEGGKGEAT